MVTTLIAQMSGLLAPISKSATRTSSTCTNGTVRGISLVCRVQQHRQWRRGREKVRTSPPSLLRSYGEAPASLTPRRGTPRRSVSEGGWRRECQSIPIERSSIFDLPRPKPTVRATAGKWVFAFDKSLSHPMARRRQQCHQATSERQIAVAPLSLIAVQSRNLMVAQPVLAQPFNFRRRSTS